MKRSFHLGDVLSVTTGRCVSMRGLQGLYKILEFMTGEEVWDVHLALAMPMCKEHLLRQFPQLDSPQMQFALGELILMLGSPTGKENKESLTPGWLSRRMIEYGEELEVESLPRDQTYLPDPKALAESLVGAEKVVEKHI